MGTRKGLRITSTDFNEPSEDIVEDHGDYETENHHTGPMANKSKKNKTLAVEGNEYEKIRQLTIQKNQKKLQELGIKDIVRSCTSLSESQKTKKNKVNHNTHAGEINFVEQHRPQFIAPMSMNRVANLTKLRRVVASNVSQKVSSTSNETQPNKQPQTVTMSETIEGNKRGSIGRMVLVDEDDDDEISQGNKEDMEVGDVGQNDEYMSDTLHEDGGNVQKQLQGPEKRKATTSYSKGSSIGRRKRLNITSTVSNECIENHVDDEPVEYNFEDHQVFETQGHQASEIQGAPKKVRGYTQKAETWKMDSKKKIVVTFNKLGKPVGDEGTELVQFLGTLVRNPDHVSIEYSDWRKVPKQKKEDMYSLVKSKFVIYPNETNKIKNWIFQSMGTKWRSWKGSLKETCYDPSLTVDEIVAQHVKNDDRYLNPTQFKELVTRWFTPEFQSICDVKRMSRSKMKEPHVNGTKSFARLAHEMSMNNNGVYPTRGEMYIATRTRKDGSIVNDKAAHFVASLKDIANESTTTPGDPEDFTNDDYSKVKGLEKRGYVRLVGRMPAEKTSGTSLKDSQTIDQLTSVVNAMAVIIQEHIPNANLSSILSNKNIHVPGIGSLVRNNSLPVNEISSSRSQDDNGLETRVDN